MAFKGLPQSMCMKPSRCLKMILSQLVVNVEDWFCYKSCYRRIKLLHKLNEDILNSHMTEDIEVEIGRGRDCEFLNHRNYRAV